MSIFQKIQKEYIKYKIYKQFNKAIKKEHTHIKRLDIYYDRELGITRNIIKLAYKYDLPVIVNDNRIPHKQYLSRTWFNCDTKFIKLSDVLDNTYENDFEILPMALCDLDDATYGMIKNLDDLHRCADVIVGAAKTH